MTDNVRNLPAQGVILDLDAETRAPEDIKPPFIFTLAGKQISMKDPSDLDWRDLASIETPADMLRVAMTAEDRAHLREQDLPGWKFNRLMEAYYTHYDLEDRIIEAQRQAKLGL